MKCKPAYPQAGEMPRLQRLCVALRAGLPTELGVRKKHFNTQSGYVPHRWWAEEDLNLHALAGATTSR